MLLKEPAFDHGKQDARGVVRSLVNFGVVGVSLLLDQISGHLLDSRGAAYQICMMSPEVDFDPKFDDPGTLADSRIVDATVRFPVQSVSP